MSNLFYFLVALVVMWLRVNWPIIAWARLPCFTLGLCRAFVAIFCYRTLLLLQHTCKYVSILFLQSTNNLVTSHVMNPGRGCLQQGGTTPKPLTLCPSTTWGPRLLETSTRLSGMTTYPNSMPSSSELSLTREARVLTKLRDAIFFDMS